MYIKIYSNFEEVEREWRIFEKSALGYPFQRYDWLICWHRLLGRSIVGYKPYIVILKDHKASIKAVFPLMVSGRFGMRILRWMGGEFSDYNSPILHAEWSIEAKAFEELWASVLSIIGKVDLIDFERQPEYVSSVANPFMYLGGKSHGRSYLSTIPKDWSLFQGGKRRPRDADSRRQKRRLDSFGSVAFKIETQYQETFDCMQFIFRMKKKRFAKTGLRDIFSSRNVRDFYSELALKTSEQTFVNLSSLRVNNEIVAAHWGLVDRGRFYSVLPAYADNGWSKYSPGRLLLEELFEWAHAAKIKVFDFTGGDEEYKKDWSTETINLIEVKAPISFIGFLYSQKLHLISKIKSSIWAVSIIRRVRVLLSKSVCQVS